MMTNFYLSSPEANKPCYQRTTTKLYHDFKYAEPHNRYFYSMDKGISLNKYISSSGFCSRRQADSIIEEGRVQINGREARRGNRVLTGDEVTIDGELLFPRRKHVYMALNKPRGIETTASPDVPNNIIDFVNYTKRLFPIGRLDKRSEGLILLTDDGEMANKVMHARYHHEKEYYVEVNRAIDKDFLEKMSTGVDLEGKMTRPCTVVKQTRKSFNITLTEGRNRQIRRMCKALGYQVRLLRRLRVMNIHLGQLPVGKWRMLNAGEKERLFSLLDQAASEADKSKKRRPPRRHRTRR